MNKAPGKESESLLSEPDEKPAVKATAGGIWDSISRYVSHVLIPYPGMSAMCREAENANCQKLHQKCTNSEQMWNLGISFLGNCASGGKSLHF